MAAEDELIFQKVHQMKALDVLILYFSCYFKLENEGHDSFSGYAVYELTMQCAFLGLVHQKLQRLIENKELIIMYEFRENVFNFVKINKIEDLKNIKNDLLELFKMQVLI